MKIKMVDLVTIALSLVVFTIVFAPTDVFAAANIFDTIQAKMLSTAKDVRKIVYVVAGFGLVMFSVLAIFNKISFKHLGYIMISLSLLAMMTPFINYFSGAGLDESDFNYGDFIIESSDASSYSNAGNQQSCEPNCPTEGGEGFGGDYADGSDPFAPGGGETDPFNPGGGDSGAGSGGNGAGGVGGNYGGSGGDYAGGDDVPTIDGGVLDEVVVTAEGKKLPQIEFPGVTSPTLPGELAPIPPTYSEPPAQNQKPLKDRIRDAITWGQGAIATVDNAIDTYESTVAAVDAVVTGAEQVGNILNGDGNIVDKLGGISSTIGSTIDSSGDWLTNATNEGASVLDALGAEGANDVAEVITEGINNAQDSAFDWTDMGEDAAAVGRGAIYTGGRLGIGK